MKYIAAIIVWPIVLFAIPARDLFFGGDIKVWPFIMLACIVVAFFNWRAASVLAVGALGSQVIEVKFEDPSFLQFCFYTTLAFTSFYLFDIVAALAAAIVGLLYFTALLGFDWKAAMIISEIVIVLGLSVSAIDGSSGGALIPTHRKPATWRAAVRPFVFVREFMGN